MFYEIAYLVLSGATAENFNMTGDLHAKSSAHQPGQMHRLLAV
jgi:hypothetical protein